tara:strand:- start:236 stop:463 length:228 start_codon:yes stop_codon:yes gene_type:complete
MNSMSPLFEVLSFLICLFLATLVSKRIEVKFSLLVIFLVAVGLYLKGPDPILFGIFLATGWHLLSVGVDNLFPLE